MTSRYVPYATTPARLLAQLVSDLVVAAWTAIWVIVGMAVHSAVAAIGNFGGDVETGANGIAGSLDHAGDNARQVPLIGDALSSPLTAAGGFARDIAGAGHQLNTTASWLAWLLALAVAAPPIMAQHPLAFGDRRQVDVLDHTLVVVDHAGGDIDTQVGLRAQHRQP